MARYEHLPIYKQAMDVAVHFEKVVAGFGPGVSPQSNTPLRNNPKRVIFQKTIGRKEDMERADIASQEEKYVAFKTAFQTLTNYQAEGNFLAAYVVAFSLIEDRVRAMFVVWHTAVKHVKPTRTQVSSGLSRIIGHLRKDGDIPPEVEAQLLEEAKIRNRLLHAAMWNLNAFDEASVERAIKLARVVDGLRRSQKKSRGQ